MRGVAVSLGHNIVSISTHHPEHNKHSNATVTVYPKDTPAFGYVVKGGDSSPCIGKFPAIHITGGDKPVLPEEAFSMNTAIIINNSRHWWLTVLKNSTDYDEEAAKEMFKKAGGTIVRIVPLLTEEQYNTERALNLAHTRQGH